jgi:hypothetical protein
MKRVATYAGLHRGSDKLVEGLDRPHGREDALHTQRVVIFLDRLWRVL